MRDPSPPRESAPTRRRAFALLFGLSLTAAACGSGSDTTVAEPQLADSAADATTDEVADEAADDSTSGDSSSTETAGAEESDDSSDEPAAVENLFPDIDVLDVATGDTLNLASELGGGDQHVLLWFYAPH